MVRFWFLSANWNRVWRSGAISDFRSSGIWSSMIASNAIIYLDSMPFFRAYVSKLLSSVYDCSGEN